MEWKVFLTVFVSVFIAELGDKTQLATKLFATDKDVSKYTVFFAASAALIVASALGVLAGALFSEYILSLFIALAEKLISNLRMQIANKNKKPLLESHPLLRDINSKLAVYALN